MGHISHFKMRWLSFWTKVSHGPQGRRSRSLNSQTKNIFIKKRQLLTTQLASAYANAGQYCHRTEWGGERTRWELAGVKFMCPLSSICLWKCQRPWLVPHVCPLINSSLIYLFIFLGSIYCPTVLLIFLFYLGYSSGTWMDDNYLQLILCRGPWPVCPSPLLLRTWVRVSG